jgi:hypothetical protein
MRQARDADNIGRIIDFTTHKAKPFGPSLLDDVMIVVTWPRLTDTLLQLF